MQTWRYLAATAWVAVFFGACDRALKDHAVPTACVPVNPEAPVLCASPDHSSRLRYQFQSPFLGPEPWPACVGEAVRNLVWHYSQAVIWLLPHLFGYGLPPRVEQCVPAMEEKKFFYCRAGRAGAAAG